MKNKNIINQPEISIEEQTVNVISYWTEKVKELENKGVLNESIYK